MFHLAPSFGWQTLLTARITRTLFGFPLESPLPISTSRDTPMRFKFSLRSLLILLSIVSFAAIFFGWRYNQRIKSQIAAQRIQDRGGEIFYRWQTPRRIKIPVSVPIVIHTVEVPYTETLQDGSKAVSYTHLTLPTTPYV